MSSPILLIEDGPTGECRETAEAWPVLDETSQRVIPNYFVAYEKNAAPLSLRQKLNLGLKTLLAPATFAAVGNQEAARVVCRQIRIPRQGR